MVGQPARVGRGLRTIAVNLSKMAKESATFEAANGKVNISLQKENGEMRSTYEILQQLGEVWGTLNETEQTAIATTIAGKTQFETFANIMKNWGTAAEVVDEATKANGSSLKENAKYLDSIEGKLQAFRSAWEQLSYHLVDSSTIKTVIGFATTLIKGLDKVVEAVDKLPKPLATAVGLLTALGAIVGSLKLLNIAEGFTAVGKAVASMGGATKTATSFTSLFAKDLSAWVAGGTSVIGTLGLIAGAAVAVGVAFAAANESYKNTFRGKVDEYHKIGEKISDIQSQIETLQSKEGGLTNEEQTRLNILQMQLQVLQKQEEIKQKEAVQAFNKEAKKNLSKDVSGLAKDSQAPDYGENYIKAQRQRLSLEKQIAVIQEESAKSGKVNEEQLEKLNKQYEEAVKNEGDWLDALIKQNDLLAELSYEELDNWGKTYYDSIHKAYLQAQTDIRLVQDAVGRAVDTFGSAQFDSWDIDVSSLESADDLVSQISQKISEMGDEEEITLYARDETGNIINEITRKKGELTDEEWELVVNATTTGDYDKLQEYINGDPEHKEILMEFIEQGLGKINSDADKTAKDRDSNINYDDNGTTGKIDKSANNAARNRNSDIKYSDKGTTAKINKDANTAAQDRSGSITFSTNLGSIMSKLNAIAQKGQQLKNGNFAKGKRKGEEGGLAWLGDEGSRSNPKPELVVGEDGAYLAGTEGWELHNVKSSDIVYTASETRKLLNGKQSFTGTVGRIPRFGKGKKKKTATKPTNANVNKAQKNVNKLKKTVKNSKGNKKTKAKKKLKSATKKLDSLKKGRDKKRSKFDSELEKLKHKAKVNHWTDKKFQEEYAKLAKKYSQYTSQDQQWEQEESQEDYENQRDIAEFEKLIEDVTPETLADLTGRINANNNLSSDEKAELIEKANEAAHKVGHDRAEKEFDRRTGLISATGTAGLTGLVKDIQGNQYLSAEEKKDAIAKAYQTAVEYNLKEYKNGKATRDDILRDIQNYYNTRGEYDEEYYKMVDELREADKEKELKRLEELEKKEVDKLTYMKKYAQRQKDAIDEQIKKEKEEADALEKLTELQDKLNNAKKTMIKVYKEGEGFVYVQDTQAIKEAQKALDDYNKEHKKSELEQKAEAWQKIIDAIGEAEDLSEMKELELNLGITDISQITGNIGLDADKWGALAKIILATEMGIADIAKVLSEANGADIEALIGATLSSGDKTISDAILNQYIGKHSFASGTLSSPSGFSLVGENGPELRYLSGGSTIFPSGISRNLMEWGQYSPAQVLSNMLGSSNNQVFNFDKIVLPNVHNADEFYKELQALPNRAIQQSTFRM